MAQILKWSLVSLIGLVVCYLIAAMLGALVPGAVAISKQSQSSFGAEIKLVSGPIHYDLLLPLNETTRERFNAFDQSGISISNSDAEWLLVGWGAKDFTPQSAGMETFRCARFGVGLPVMPQSLELISWADCLPVLIRRKYVCPTHNMISFWSLFSRLSNEIQTAV